MAMPSLGLTRLGAKALTGVAELKLRARPAARQPARQLCAGLCVCASTGLKAKEAGHAAQLGHILSDHGSSAAPRTDSGGAAAPAGSRASQQQSKCSAVGTIDAEVMAAPPSGSRKPPWNKGRTMSAATREKIRLAQQRRWKDPQLRATVSDKLRGKTPWNKGLKMSDETRARMAAARLDKPLLKSTRKKLSRSHLGLTHKPEVVAAVAAKLRGQPKTAQHRQNIAAAQRRRHAACRVLRAIEEVHGATKQSSSFDASRFRSFASDTSSSGLKGVKGSRPPSRVQILTTYRNQLREYRALQEELTPWTEAFQKKHGCKPRLVDVERTGIEWLITKFKSFIMMRERLVIDTPKLRARLDSDKPGAEALTSMDESAISWAPSASGNPTVASAGTGAARYVAAMQRKRAAVTERAVPPAQPAGAPIGDTMQPPMRAAPRASIPVPAPHPIHVVVPAATPAGAAAMPPWAAGQPSAQAAATAAVPVPAGSGGTASSQRPGAAAGGSPPGSPGRAALQQPPPHAPQRVRSAMAAALLYRQKKAQETAAAAAAAASAAALPPSVRSTKRATS